MKLKIRLSYHQDYLPSKRHRTPRMRVLDTLCDFELKEVKEPDDFPVALVVSDYKTVWDEKTGESDYKLTKEEVRTHAERLYRVAKGRRDSLTPISEAIEDLASKAYIQEWLRPPVEGEEAEIVILGDDKDEKEHAILKEADRYIVFKNILYEECGEPYYDITTFGLGNNHGGTGFFIQWTSEEWRQEENKLPSGYSAFEREEAIKAFREIAEGRGDTKDVSREIEDNIEVLIPEALKLEHIPDFHIPVVWQMTGRVTVKGKARTAEEAFKYVEEHPDEFDLPPEWRREYLEGSFEVCRDMSYEDERYNLHYLGEDAEVVV